MNKTSYKNLKKSGNGLIPDKLIEKIVKNSQKLQKLNKKTMKVHKKMINVFCKLKSIFFNKYLQTLKEGDILVVLSCKESGECIAYDVKLVKKDDNYIRCQEGKYAYVSQRMDTEEYCKENAEYASCIVTKEMYDELKQYLSISHWGRKF